MVAQPQRDDGESQAVVGVVVPLNTQGVAPNISVQATQLISARVGRPRQWVITLMQATQSVARVNPWMSPFDGTATGWDNTLAGTRNFSAPELPLDAGGNAGQLQVQLRWGAGGAAWETKFDYPLAGCAFGLTADHVDLFVNVRPGQATVYADARLVPVVGAFMVEGQSVNATPLRWSEATANIANNGHANWAVKPYARQVRVSLSAAGAFQLAWSDAAGQSVWVQDVTTSNTLADVPVQAAVLTINNFSGGPKGVRVEWAIGLT